MARRFAPPFNGVEATPFDGIYVKSALRGVRCEESLLTD